MTWINKVEKRLLWQTRARLSSTLRSFSTFLTNNHVKIFENYPIPGHHVLTVSDTFPPNLNLAIGTTTTLPPTSSAFQENPHFRTLLYEVIITYGHHDAQIHDQARQFINQRGIDFMLGAGRPPQRDRRQSKEEQEKDEARKNFGGHVHLSDSRNTPDFGRIAWPEDIFGSVEVSSEGEVVGKVEPSGTYRILTNDGILGLSPFLMEKLIERIKQEEQA